MPASRDLPFLLAEGIVECAQREERWFQPYKGGSRSSRG